MASKPKAKAKAKVGAATPAPETEVNKDAAALEAEVDTATAAPEGVPVAVEPKTAVAAKPKKNEDGQKSITPTGKFEAVGVEIYNKAGVLIGVEVDEATAARKADRYNSLHR